MGKASREKRQKELQAESILNGKSLISSDISSKWSLFNKPVVHFSLIAILGFLVYSNTFDVPFHFDDDPNIVENYKLRYLSNLWPPSGSRWCGYLTFALNYYFGGLNTLGYHIVNLAIHSLNAILVYLLVALTLMIHDTRYKMQDREEILQDTASGTHSTFNLLNYLPLFSALLFVAHPIQTQAVTYIVQRFTSLATFFYLLSLIMYIKFRIHDKNHVSWILYLASLFSAVLAMKTKEIAFTLPVIIALYEFMFFEGNFKKRILYLLPLLLTMLIIPLSFIGIDKPIGDAIGELREAAQETELIPRDIYLFTQFRVILTYIRLLFLPINQNLDYDYSVYHSFFNPEVFLSFLFLLIIFCLAVYLLHSKRYTLPATRLISFGIFWFFITLSVESSIIPIRDVIFEHRLYLPSIGIIVVFVSATFYILQTLIQDPKRSLAACYLLLATIVIVFSIAAYQRNTAWRDEVSLWEDVVEKSPRKARAHNEFGIAHGEKGMLNVAIQEFQTALSLKSDYASAHYNLGIVYGKKGMLDAALREFQLSLLLGYSRADVYTNIGAIYWKKGLTEKAINLFQYALMLKPGDATTHFNLGVAYKSKGWTDKTIEHFQIALKLNPDYSNAHNNLGAVYENKGLLDEAIKEYRTALRLDSENETARNNLNRALQIQKSK